MFFAEKKFKKLTAAEGKTNYLIEEILNLLADLYRKMQASRRYYVLMEFVLVFSLTMWQNVSYS